ncbi:hypothetical protein GCM10009760_12890 [Kitasatospora kazusensis]|uniref:Uncharacterized protein n=1 Tax=Kitasatospora kazusensis TaxID=407974 RepID=A0ABN2Z0S9_9ACTN
MLRRGLTLVYSAEGLGFGRLPDGTTLPTSDERPGRWRVLPERPRARRRLCGTGVTGGAGGILGTGSMGFMGFAGSAGLGGPAEFRK